MWSKTKLVMIPFWTVCFNKLFFQDSCTCGNLLPVLEWDIRQSHCTGARLNDGMATGPVSLSIFATVVIICSWVAHRCCAALFEFTKRSHLAPSCRKWRGYDTLRLNHVLLMLLIFVWSISSIVFPTHISKHRNHWMREGLSLPVMHNHVHLDRRKVTS